MAKLPCCPPPPADRPLERPDPALVAALVAGDGDAVASRLAGDDMVNPDALRPYIFFDGSKPYTRNVVTVNEHYALIAMCWSPGRSSPVHDHSGSGCWLRVISGGLTESLFSGPSGEGGDKAFPDEPLSSSDGEKDAPPTTAAVDCAGGGGATAHTDRALRLVSRRPLRSGSCSYMADDLGLHAVSNASSVTPAVSLHCYAPPFASCQVFGRVRVGGGIDRAAIERVGKKVHMTFDSVGGQILGEHGDALIKSFVPLEREGGEDTLMYDI